jgi:SAM-dependent methyltransferase
MSTKSYIKRYMREEYSSIDSEIRLVGRLLFDNAKGKVLDFGCGPSLLYWAMFMQKATSIDGFDIVPENIGYLKALISRKRKPQIYGRLASYVQTELLRGKEEGLVEECFAKVKGLKVGNILRPAPFEGRYDTVTEIGCIGCVDTEAELLRAAGNMHTCLRKGGTAVFVNWSERRTARPEEVPQFDGPIPITKALFGRTFAKAGFHDVKLAYKRNGPAYEFGTIIYGTAKG